ncbi:flavodoxin family protein [Brachybacterium sp. JB7]|uniref:NAD(P)H-dependent oxidoreductase n=1 Tax=Brachybacterium TaxID=43668 RepID=UPI000BB6EC4B|nr:MULTISPECIES: NAD(P)H-dependent oxidoreductase [Brachybacterium]PCC35861.1 NADPH-quinone reductase [Brachybacterium alimentarium]RCS63441.1 flavodoxin family protein [Brachybacterium sp. JB7]
MTASTHPETQTALWVYAHPRGSSLNAHVYREGVSTLAQDHRILTSDLYAQGFDPVLRESDLGRFSGSPGGVADLLGEAFTEQQLLPDVREEQWKIAEAELLVLQFPLWWYGMPAILKGWFDRVLTAGFAHGEVDPRTGLPLRYGDGGLSGRRALIIVTAGEDARSIGPRGISGDLDSLLFPLTHGALWYSGVETYALHTIYDADDLDTERVDDEIQRLRDRLRGLSDERTRPFRRLSDGQYRGTRALHPDLAPGRTDLGIHLAGD